MGPDLEACLDPEDLDRFRSFGRTLSNEIVQSMPRWIDTHVAPRCLDFLGPGHEATARLPAELDLVSARVEERLDRMVSAPLSESVSGPLEQVRLALTPTSSWLFEQRTSSTEVADRSAGDPLELGPVTFRDLSDAVHDAGIQWGAAKAFLHQQMRSQADRSE